MKSIRRGIALLMAGLLAITPLRVNATEVGEMTVGDALEMETYVSENEVSVLSTEDVEDAVEEISDMIIYNTGNHEYSVASSDAQGADAVFAEDGSYTINIPEEDPFFPYEVQFKCGDSVTYEWFMNPNDSVQIGGHTFRVNANFTGEVLTQLTLNVAGSTVIAYPKEKEYTNEAMLDPETLNATEYKNSFELHFENFSPMDLRHVSIKEIYQGNTALDTNEKIALAYRGDNYQIYDENGYFDFSYGALTDSTVSSYGDSSYFDLLITDNQIKNNIENYSLYVYYSPAGENLWLEPAVYFQNANGERKKIDNVDLDTDLNKGNYETDYWEHYLRYSLGQIPTADENASLFVGYKISDSFSDKKNYDYLKVYSGKYRSVDEAMQGEDITNQFFADDMTKKDAGMSFDCNGDSKYVTIVSFDATGNALTTLPICVSNRAYPPSSLSYSYLLKSMCLYNSSDVIVSYTSSSGYDNGLEDYEIKLSRGYSSTEQYCLKATVRDDVTAIYQGNYSSMEDIVSAGAENVKALITGSGYTADFSAGIDYTAVTEDGTLQGFVVKATNYPGSSITHVNFIGFIDKNGNLVKSCLIGNGLMGNDGYADGTYVNFLVEPGVDLSQLSPVFELGEEHIKLYTDGTNGVEVSGVSVHDFSDGKTVHYSASAEDNEHSTNYYLSAMSVVEGKGSIYITSLRDEVSQTRVEDGVIYSTREIVLDSINGYHDILVENFGTESLPGMTVELNSDVFVMDDYWTYNGNYALMGCNPAMYDKIEYYETSKRYYRSQGKPENLSKLRLRVKEGVTQGTLASGTLTIKSNGQPLMVLSLTGLVGQPVITTTDIPNAVKYVPYGTMIQNNNKYHRNKVTYTLYSGNLPEGMALQPNGELYGVPKEEGSFNFTVQMVNSLFKSEITKTFTLTVLENTDTNVDDADYGAYYLSTKINHDLDTSAIQSEYLMVSQGTYDQFVALYLDGEKLTSGSDYTSESGSTRITIKGQTLASGGSGTHTLGIEFRTQDGTYKLERAAQNYVVNGTGTPTIIPPSDIANNTTNTPVANPTPAAAPSNTVVAISSSYTVQSGDTLWKIAQKVYGNGALWNKIYADNKAIIKNPNKIYVGQVLMIYPIVGDGTVITSGNSTGNYVVQSGDTLWKIAKKKYGRSSKWRKIYKANKSTMSDPNKLRVGQVIVLPD